MDTYGDGFFVAPALMAGNGGGYMPGGEQGMNTRATAFPLRVQVCKLNPTFYPFEHLIDGMTLLYYQKQGSGYKPEPAGVRQT